MPSRHRYKCLNPNCPSMTNAARTLTFVTLNSPQPMCPHCECIKLEDWGEALEPMVGIDGGGKQSDANLRRIADKYGLTDMNNRDGQAVKRAAPQVTPSGPMVNIAGVQISADAAASGGCISVPGMAQPMKAPVGEAQPKSSPMMRQMTRVVAEHKANV